MKLETIITSKTNEKLEYFPELTISVEKGGIRVRARSPIFAAYINGLKTAGSRRDVNAFWRNIGGIEYVHLAFKDRVFPANGLWFADADGNAPNLVWLFHKDLEKGMDITLPQPIALNDLQNYFSETCELLQEFYVNFIRTAEFSAQLSEVFSE